MRKHLRAAWEFIVALVTRFREERVTQTAGSLTYTTLLSLVPLFTVALAVSTAFPAFDEWISSLQLFILENVLPDTPAVNTLIEQINTFSENAARLTAIGIAGFVVTSVMPARRVEWRHAVLGGLLAGVGFEIAKRGFAIYLSRVPTYTLIYGAFATIPIFFIWLYLSWVVVLTGAVFTAMLPVFGRKP